MRKKICTLNGCSCPSGAYMTADNCSKKIEGYYCTSGTQSGSKCIYIDYDTKYNCDDGYTKINNSWCYK